nr:unnamed protein product [Callosobruchus analis]
MHPAASTIFIAYRRISIARFGFLNMRVIQKYPQLLD